MSLQLEHQIPQLSSNWRMVSRSSEESFLWSARTIGWSAQAQVSVGRKHQGFPIWEAVAHWHHEQLLFLLPSAISESL